MLFDPEGLEMATHEALAAYHASLFPDGEYVCDLTAGIGADLIALAARGKTLGLEVDAGRAELARHNLAVHGLGAAVWHMEFSSPPVSNSVLCSQPARNEPDDGRVVSTCPSVEMLLHWEIYHASYVFADPARRSGGRRFTDPSEFQPNPIKIVEVFDHCNLGVIKLSPMLPDEFLESLGSRLEFVSFGGECREALAIFGSQAEPGRLAVQIESGERLVASEAFVQEVLEPEAYLYEADPAAIRAHAIGDLARQFNLKSLSDSNGYLTGCTEIRSPWLTGFRVLDSGRIDVKLVKKRLIELGSATPVLKQRGTKLDLQKLQKQMIFKGKQNLEVAFYTVGNSIRQAILERLR